MTDTDTRTPEPETAAPAVPAASANKTSWIAYAVTQGMLAETAKSMTKNALVEKYTVVSPDATPRAKAPDTSNVSLNAINGAALAAPDLVSASAPTRERTDQQKAMDAVAVKAYDAWVKAERPSLWQKMPVVTYFLDPDEVAPYRYLIRRACAIVEPSDGSIGVRVRFGTEFTLSEAMAAKINRPDDAGKTVLAWTAIDKRTSDDKNKPE